MMKFFRKHMRKLLAAAMCLLLISWLGGSALQSMMQPDRGGATWATYVGGEITYNEQRVARQQTEVLRQLRLTWQRPLAQYQGVELDLPSWLLLGKEAHRMGIHSSRPVVEAMLRQHQESFRRQGIGVPGVAQVASRMSVKQEVVYAAAAAFADILRYGTRMGNATGVNAAEIRRYAENALSRVRVKVAVLRAEMFQDPEATFPELELREQFEKYQNQKRSGTGLNFGYVLPRRVKVQYVKIDSGKIEEVLSAGDAEMLTKATAGASPGEQATWEQAEARLTHREGEDLDRANKYWRKHKQYPAFALPPKEKTGDEATSQPADENAESTSQPATAPAEEEQESAFFTSWRNEPELWAVALREIRRADAAEGAHGLADWLLEHMAEPWDHAEVASNGFKIPVEAAQHADHFAQQLASAPANLAFPDAVTITTTDWISSENVFEVPGIGGAALPNPTGPPIRFADLALHVEGLMEIPTGEDAAGVDRSSFMTLHQTCRYAMTDSEGNIYVFRPVEIDGERPARTLDEVRDQVVDDLRFARGYQQALAAAEALRQAALQGDGLQAAWNVDEALRNSVDSHNETADPQTRQAGFHETVQVNRRRTDGTLVDRVGPIGVVDEAFLDACFSMRDATAPDARLLTIAIPGSGTAVVAEWVGDSPLNEQQFAALQQHVARQIERQRVVDYMPSWLAPKQIKARNGFKFER